MASDHRSHTYDHAEQPPAARTLTMATPEGPTTASDATVTTTAVTTTTPHGTVTVWTTPMTTPNGAVTARRGATRTSSAQGDAVGRFAGAAPHRGALSPAHDHFERHQEDGPVTATTRR
ncbi:hypothetical protein E1286_18680 [Nonomuraea terrae]|uniref:Uncharacterized protein n=1 Tax=Nonomuraea terrae TaxID=2530383 RepID=A0A4R4YPJ8_9ACTN|nr:hypothetical protein [Nonomuraea terrae]TDD47088.1 hypothetical protein E1286_18680 [Nonomuraea terrae]